MLYLCLERPQNSHLLENEQADGVIVGHVVQRMEDVCLHHFTAITFSLSMAPGWPNLETWNLGVYNSLLSPGKGHFLSEMSSPSTLCIAPLP